MSRVKVVLLLSMVVVSGAMVTSSAWASEYVVESKGLGETQEATGTGGPSKLESTIAGEKVTIECSKNSIKGVIEPAGASEGKVTFSECKVLNKKHEVLSACKVQEPVEVKFTDQLVTNSEKKIEDEYKSTKAEETFVELSITGASCAVKITNAKIKGTQVCELPKGEEPAVEHKTECKPSGSKLKLGTSEAQFTSTDSTKLVSGKKWKVGSTPAAPATNCPITSEGVTFNANVTTGNEATIRESVVNSTWGPEGEGGKCKEVGELNAYVSGGKVTKSQKEAYQKYVAELVVPGTTIYAFKWHRSGGSSFTTLGVSDSPGTVAFEPIGSWGELEEHIPRPPVSKEGSFSFGVRNLFGMEPASATVTLKLETINEITFENPISLLNTLAYPLYEIGATEERILPNPKEGAVECYQIKVTYSVVSGLKSLSVSGGGNGFSASITIQGSLGMSGSFQRLYRLCANGARSEP